MRRLLIATSVCLAFACTPEPDPSKIQLPTPSGPHVIGVVDFEVVDDTRVESYAPGTPRRIPVRAWYPASSVRGGPRPYAKPLEMKHQLQAFYSGVVPQGEEVPNAFDVPTNAYEDATPIDERPLPTVVFSHGGFGFLQTNTALMEHLASHGYLVLSISHPYLSIATIHENGDIVRMDDSLVAGMMESAADPAYLAAFIDPDPGVRLEAHLRNADAFVLAPHFLVWQDDFRSVVDRLEAGELPEAASFLEPLVDLDRLGAFGMSFGASGSAAAHKDERIRAAVNLDGGVFDSALYDREVAVPVLALHSDTSQLVAGSSVYPYSEFVYEELESVGTRSDVVRLEVKGSTHMGFTDACLLPDSLREDPVIAALAGSTHGQRMAEIMNVFVKRFFDQHLSGIGNGVDASLVEQYPEVVDVDLSAVREWAATDPKPGFMSYTHVFQMNRLLAVDEASRDAARALDRRYVMAYELSNGPDGDTVWWQLHFDPEAGMSFSLEEPDETPDLTFRGDYMEMIIATKSARDGGQLELALETVGDESMLATTAAAFAAGQRAATIEAEFPQPSEE